MTIGKTKRTFKFILVRGFGFAGGFIVAAGIALFLGLLISSTSVDARQFINPKVIATVGLIGGFIGALFPKFTTEIGVAVLQHWP